MKKKVIDMFSKEKIAKNTGKEYSDILTEIVKTYEKEFPQDMYLDDVFEFTINAWNTACMGQVLPEDELNRVKEANPLPEPMDRILEEMIALKNEKYADYDRFFSDFELEEKNGELMLTVTAQEKEDFIRDMMDELSEFEPDEADFEEGYINRCAVALRPNQPFLDWSKSLNHNSDFHQKNEANMYLVHETEGDFEQWLKKNFDKFFMAELYESEGNKKKWPQKRNYKMFREWFHVEISTMIYDFEKDPVFKGS